MHQHINTGYETENQARLLVRQIYKITTAFYIKIIVMLKKQKVKLFSCLPGKILLQANILS